MQVNIQPLSQSVAVGIEERIDVPQAISASSFLKSLSFSDGDRFLSGNTSSVIVFHLGSRACYVLFGERAVPLNPKTLQMTLRFGFVYNGAFMLG